MLNAMHTYSRSFNIKIGYEYVCIALRASQWVAYYFAISQIDAIPLCDTTVLVRYLNSISLLTRKIKMIVKKGE